MPKLRIFHSADWHIGKGLGTIDRTDDFRVFIRDFLELVEKRRPDVILLAGDIFDTSMPANSAQRLYYDMIRALSGTSVMATVITAGNHDSQRFLEAPRALLETMNCFVAGESPESQAFVLRDDAGEPLVVDERVAAEGRLLHRVNDLLVNEFFGRVVLLDNRQHVVVLLLILLNSGRH